MDFEFQELQSAKRKRKSPPTVSRVDRDDDDTENVHAVNKSRAHKDFVMNGGSLVKAGSMCPSTDKTIVIAKKMHVSSEEKIMNGAPDVDLYEVQLLADDQLQPLSQEGNDLHTICMSYRSATIWAEKYQHVETIRRVVMHGHCVCSPFQLVECLQVSLDEMASLRSTSSRNAMLLLNRLALLINFNDQEPLLKSCVDQLLAKVRSGPRFLTEESVNVFMAVMSLDSHQLNPMVCITHLLSYSDHKNVDVVNAVYKAIVMLLRRLDSDSVCLSNFKALLPFLARGLSSKSVQAKEHCRNCFQQMRTKYPQTFESFLNENMKASEVIEIKRCSQPTSQHLNIKATVGNKLIKPSMTHKKFGSVKVLKDNADERDQVLILL